MAVSDPSKPEIIVFGECHMILTDAREAHTLSDVCPCQPELSEAGEMKRSKRSEFMRVSYWLHGDLKKGKSHGV